MVVIEMITGGTVDETGKEIEIEIEDMRVEDVEEMRTEEETTTNGEKTKGEETRQEIWMKDLVMRTIQNSLHPRPQKTRNQIQASRHHMCTIP
jgi:hypothetical protein